MKNPKCTKCNSQSTIKNGSNGYSQRYKCKDCGATFTNTKLGRRLKKDEPLSVKERVYLYREKRKQEEEE